MYIELNIYTESSSAQGILHLQFFFRISEAEINYAVLFRKNFPTILLVVYMVNLYLCQFSLLIPAPFVIQLQGNALTNTNITFSCYKAKIF
jgi:hypothetical protein